MSHERILHIYIMVTIDTLTRMLKTFVMCSYKYQNIRDVIVPMSEYSLMCKYSLIEFHTLILYDIIDGRYMKIGSLSFLSIFLLLSI